MRLGSIRRAARLRSHQVLLQIGLVEPAADPGLGWGRPRDHPRAAQPVEGLESEGGLLSVDEAAYDIRKLGVLREQSEEVP
jgi:hypothetical protein